MSPWTAGLVCQRIRLQGNLIFFFQGLQTNIIAEVVNLSGDHNSIELVLCASVSEDPFVFFKFSE